MLIQSQIATSVEQSQRLIDFGVPIDTADMSRNTCTDELFCEPYRKRSIEQKGDEIPAWSLSRLLDIMGNNGAFNINFTLGVCEVEIIERQATYTAHPKRISTERIFKQCLSGFTPFEVLVNAIENLIATGGLSL